MADESVLESDAVLLDATVIGERSRLGFLTRIDRHAVIGAGSRTARGTRVAPRAQVGTVRPVFGDPDRPPQAPGR